MIHEQLFEKILLGPIERGADDLKIISGYATSAMAFHHLNRVRHLEKKIQLSLVVGMTPDDGLSLSNHRGFQKIMNEDFRGSFECSYIMNPPPVHSKLYVWSKSGKPFESFIGSANYTQRAFISKAQKEIITPSDPDFGLDYFDKVSSDSIFCTHQEAEIFVNIFNDNQYKKRKRLIAKRDQEDDEPDFDELSGLDHVNVTFINRSGEISKRSALNWGQRPEEGREPNQAYIPLKAEVYKTDFFPPVGQHFTIFTDDNKILICSRAQQNGKAIHTPHDNSLIGEYFRNRLGVPNGGEVLREHFDNYGRVDIDFYKIDEETYFMDFSKPQQ
jgi:hypothetical protein